MMNKDFNAFLEERKENIRNASIDDVRDSMAKAEEQERVLLITIHSLFAKKRSSACDTLKAMEGMDMMLDILKHAAPDSIAKDVPDNKAIIEKCRNVISAIDGVVSALQEYSIANSEFDKAVLNDCEKKEEFKKNFDD